jgi:pSer/pThr/pTyr-binding forkhead associated (FHA) protein
MMPVSPPPAPFQPSAKPGDAERPVTPPTSGGTVIIQRGPKLKVLGMLVNKKDTSRRFDIDRPSVTLGRAPGNDFVVEHATVSRQHATIKIEGEDLRLYDLGSANGTFVNDKRVREPVTLQDGDAVRLGEAEFIFKRVVL